MTRVDELRNRIEGARDALSKSAKGVSTPQIEIVARTSRHQGEIVAAASELAEIFTRRLVKLTWCLVVLTIGLLLLTGVLTLFTRALTEDTHRLQIEREQHRRPTGLTEPINP